MLQSTHFVAIFSLCFFVVCAVCLGWTLMTVRAIGSQFEAQVVTIANNSARESAYRSLEQLIAETQTERAQLQTYLLTEQETSSFLTNIEHLGEKMGVALATDSLEVKKQSGLFDLLTIRFSLEGDRQHIDTAISLFENLPYHSYIKNLTITTEERGSTRSTLEVVVTLLKEES